MKKQTFIKFMKKLMELKKAEENLNKAFKKFNLYINFVCFDRYEAFIVDVLKEAMNDTSGWIGYFLYERNGKFEKSIDKSPVSDKGKKIPFRNFSDLYNLITKI